MEAAAFGAGTGAYEPFGMRVVHDSTGVVLRLSGEFDLRGHLQFEAEVQDLQRDFSELVIDLREVTFMDSCGLRSLMGVWEQSRRDSFELGIVRGPAQVQKVVELTSLDTVLPLMN